MAGGRVADQIGRVLGGRYRLVAPIGTGGSAHVYVADDTTLRRRVAVKVLQPALALDQAFLRRFRAEAQAAAALNHPNIMRVFDWGEDEEGPFLVMEFLGGGSLRDMLDAGHRLSVAQTILVGLETARALDYAHRRSLIHRDIKPANVCFDEEGRTAIADFGLARALAEAAWTEPDGVLLGTARYAAPEAAQGRNVDGKADVYALGLVLLEAVTGESPPVADTTVATLMARANQPIVAPFGLGPLAPIIDAAGVVDPDDRPDAAALAVMLDAAARQLDTPAPLPVSAVLNLDARSPSISDPTELGATEALPVIPAPKARKRAPAPEPIGGKSRKRISLVLGALALAAVITVGALYVPTILKPTHPVPALGAMTLADAREALAPLNFKLTSSEEFSETVAAGAVISQDPGVGETLREDKTVHVVISKGREPVPVPDVGGKALGEAKATLEGAGFIVDENVPREFSEDIPKDIVLSRKPADAEIPRGTVITLTASEGPQPRTIADWTNKTFTEAKTGLEAQGLKVKRVDGFSDTVAKGNVISTDPGPNANAAKGATVTVTVAAGPATVAVPDVTGKTVEQASNLLQQAGLRVGQILGPGNGNKRHVFTTDPGPGERAPRNSAVTLYVTRN